MLGITIDNGVDCFYGSYGMYGSAGIAIIIEPLNISRTILPTLAK
jgi:hypothetical protein